MIPDILGLNLGNDVGDILEALDEMLAKVTKLL